MNGVHVHRLSAAFYGNLLPKAGARDRQGDFCTGNSENHRCGRKCWKRSRKAEGKRGSCPSSLPAVTVCCLLERVPT